jgi:hypothetical protein
MGEFSAAWLGLREPVDHAARSAALTREVLRTRRGPLRILDLGCGTGSNLRYIGGQVLHFNIESPAGCGNTRPDPGGPDWLLVDHDPALLAHVPSAPGVKVLEHDLTSLDDRLFRERTLVTASALLDLVSESWMRRLTAQCRAQRAAALFALTYDGRLAFEPAEPEDGLVTALVNRHQQTDKGFGPALGPAATEVAADLFRHAGYDVQTASSDWMLSRASAPDALQDQLIDGWAAAATELAPDRAAAIDRWREARHHHVASGRSLVTVGHQDLAAVPSAP